MLRSLPALTVYEDTICHNSFSREKCREAGSPQNSHSWLGSGPVPNRGQLGKSPQGTRTAAQPWGISVKDEAPKPEPEGLCPLLRPWAPGSSGLMSFRDGTGPFLHLPPAGCGLRGLVRPSPKHCLQSHRHRFPGLRKQLV